MPAVLLIGLYHAAHSKARDILVQKVEMRMYSKLQFKSIWEPLSFWNKVMLTIAQNYNKAAPDTVLGPWRLESIFETSSDWQELVQKETQS